MTRKDKEQEENDDDVYCICRQPWDGSQLMIQCDSCEEWFHGLCVDITKEESEAYKRYECDSCSSKPGAQGSIIYTKEQLAVVNREEARQAAEDRAKKAREKRGKRSKAKEKEKEKESSPAPAPKTVEEIPGELRATVRKVFTNALSKHIQSTGGQVAGDGPTTSTTDQLASTVEDIESALHACYKDGDEYRNQFRFLVLNLKRQENAHVRERLLQGELSPSEFVVMTADELASKDLAAYRRKREADLDKQIIREASSGPVYRNTHKGVELITPGDGVGRAGDINEGFDPGRGPIKPITEEEADAEGPQGNITTHTTTTAASNANGPSYSTKTQGNGAIGTSGSTGELEMPDFDDFDAFARSTEQAEDLTSNGNSEGVSNDIPTAEPYEDDTEHDRNNGDPEHDALTVPKASAAVMWKGECGTPADSSTFHVTASFLCGRAPGHKFELPTLLPSRLLVHGRMRTEAMAKYLNDINNSDKRELSLLLLNPDLDQPDGEPGYQRLHTLLTELSRVAVIPPPGDDHPFTDIYVTAIQSSAPPAFIPVPVPTTREDRLVLVVVSKWNHGAAGAASSRRSDSNKARNNTSGAGGRGDRTKDRGKRTHPDTTMDSHRQHHHPGAKRARHAPPPALPSPVPVAAPLAGGALPPHLFATITELIKQSEASKASNGSDNDNVGGTTGGGNDGTPAAPAAAPPTRSWADPIGPPHPAPRGRGPAIHPERQGQYNGSNRQYNNNNNNTTNTDNARGHYPPHHYRQHDGRGGSYRDQPFGQRGGGGGGGRYDDRYHRR